MAAHGTDEPGSGGDSREPAGWWRELIDTAPSLHRFHCPDCGLDGPGESDPQAATRQGRVHEQRTGHHPVEVTDG